MHPPHEGRREADRAPREHGGRRLEVVGVGAGQTEKELEAQFSAEEEIEACSLDRAAYANSCACADPTGRQSPEGAGRSDDLSRLGAGRVQWKRQFDSHARTNPAATEGSAPVGGWRDHGRTGKAQRPEIDLTRGPYITVEWSICSQVCGPRVWVLVRQQGSEPEDKLVDESIAALTIVEVDWLWTPIKRDGPGQEVSVAIMCDGGGDLESCGYSIVPTQDASV